MTGHDSSNLNPTLVVPRSCPVLTRPMPFVGPFDDRATRRDEDGWMDGCRVDDDDDDARDDDDDDRCEEGSGARIHETRETIRRARWTIREARWAR